MRLQEKNPILCAHNPPAPPLAPFGFQKGGPSIHETPKSKNTCGRKEVPAQATTRYTVDHAALREATEAPSVILPTRNSQNRQTCRDRSGPAAAGQREGEEGGKPAFSRQGASSVG